ncbi:MAG: TrkA family potassium uptake protein [Anaerolineaceae bacterium]|nr:TrkA family potassium uptake protein [Anaerolineaceae bacterium]
MKSFVVIGLGRFGSRIARKLYSMNCEVLAVDIDNEKVQQIADEVTQAVTGDAEDKDVLRALGVRNCDCAIVCMASNLSASIIVTMNLKELEVPFICAKAQGKMHQKILEKLGADSVVIPEREMADRLANKLVEPNILDVIEISEDYSLVEEQAPEAWYNKSIKDLSVRARLGVNIIAVKNGKDINIAPGGEYVVQKGDVLVIIGRDDALAKLRRK